MNNKKLMNLVIEKDGELQLLGTKTKDDCPACQDFLADTQVK
jgi:hypothetical protein